MLCRYCAKQRVGAHDLKKKKGASDCEAWQKHKESTYWPCLVTHNLDYTHVWNLWNL